MSRGGKINNSKSDSVAQRYLGEALICCHSVHLNEAALFDVALSVFVRLVVVEIERLLRDKWDRKKKVRLGHLIIMISAHLFSSYDNESKGALCLNNHQLYYIIKHQ